MKKVLNLLTAVSLLVFFALFYGCKKDPVLPTLTTTAVTAVTTNSATSGGNITANGGAEVTARGICWGTATNPTISGSKTSDGTDVGIFVSALTNLTPNTPYFVRAYATNSVGTAYGNQLTFNTAAIVGATITTTKPTFTATTATTGGTITADGGAAVTERGVCWALTANPTTTTGTKIVGTGTGTGTFPVTITGLQPATLYHVRAYAINTSGTSYGGDEAFTTLAVKPSVTTALVTIFEQTTATAGGEVTSTGGAAITERGVYWGLLADPSTTGTKAAATLGQLGTFTVALSNLAPATKYYVKAFATNSQGTEFGTEVSFTTKAVTGAILTTTAPTFIPTSSTSVTAGGNITSDGGGAVTQRGVCYSTTALPDYQDPKVAATAGGTGAFTVTLPNLAEGTTYYVRAYAVNSFGTTYGNELYILTMMSDADNNIYKTVQIGTQVWMAENLATKKYNDNSNITNVTGDAEWIALTTEAYCWYANDETTYKPLYGAIYNWYAVNEGNLCPAGWRVPTDEDWTTLTTYLLGETVAGGKLKEAGTTHWLTPNTGATNETGFTALPGGYRYRVTGTFADAGKLSYWWSSTEYQYDAAKAYFREMFNDQASIYREGAYKTAGKYVRCVK